MKIAERLTRFCLIALCTLLPMSSSAQDSIPFAQDVRVVVDAFGHTRLKGAQVTFTANKRTYKAEYITVNENYRFDSLPSIEGTFKVTHPEYESQSRRVVPISKGWNSGYNSSHRQYQFTLGKPGCAYTLSDGRLYPYTRDDFFWGLSYNRGQLQATMDYLDREGFIVLRHYEKNRSLIVYPNQGDSARYRKLPWQDDALFKYPQKINTLGRAGQLGVLAACNGIAAVGPLYTLGNKFKGCFPGSFTVNFVLRTTPEEKERIRKKYNLEFVKDPAGQTHILSMKKGWHRINKVIILMMKEPSILSIQPSIGYFELPPAD